MSRPANLTVPPSCHHHSGIRIASAPRPLATDTSTAENEPSEYFWATTDPPQTTAVVTSAPYAASSEGVVEIADCDGVVEWLKPERRRRACVGARSAPSACHRRERRSG